MIFLVVKYMPLHMLFICIAVQLDDAAAMCVFPCGCSSYMCRMGGWLL